MVAYNIMFLPVMMPLPRHRLLSGVYITANWPGAMPWTGVAESMRYSLSERRVS